MTPAAIIRHAAADGVNITLSPAGTIKASGDRAAVNHWLPFIREYKHDLIAALRAANDELRLLVPAVVRASGDDAEMGAYCLAHALADPIDALTSYRLLAMELDVDRETMGPHPALQKQKR